MNYKISKLQTTNFRNLSSDIISFGPKINCILGENGNGKTNILEAIHILAKKKSFRKNANFPQFLGIDGEKPEIIFSSVFESQKEKFSLSGKMEELNSSWFLNGQIVKKNPNIHIIFINPFDSNTFHNQASFRREWFNEYFSMLDSYYKKSLFRYNKGLKLKNSLLSKKPPHYKEQIEALDKGLAQEIFFLVNKRLEFLNDFHKFITPIFMKIFSENHHLTIKLKSEFVNLNEKQIYEYLREHHLRDDIIGHARHGSHKDDYLLLFDGLNSYDYCSLGQQKISFLSLIFAYIELFRYKYSSYPIVLIDDVSGELDRFRWQNLINHLERSEFQVLITTANEKFKEELEKIVGAFKLYIKSGAIYKTQN